MGIVWGVVGALIGALIDSFADAWPLGMVGGVVIGVLYAKLRDLDERTDRLQTQLSDLWTDRAIREAQQPRQKPAVPITANVDLRSAAPTPIPQSAAEPVHFDLGHLAPPPLPQQAASETARPAAQEFETTRIPPRTPPAPLKPSGIENAIAAIKRWFTEGNVPVKVGMLVLFAGVAALLKYAADEGWFTAPIEVRLAGVTLAAIAALGFGWRQREQRRAFALSLQGGAIGILLLTVFAAFHRYHLLPAGAAFGLMLVLVAGVGVLAVLQDALALAVLGILAGFAAPILISTGNGSHVTLFSYYALLNVAIFAIAWVRPWRALNLLGFFFTYAIATAWGVLSYQPEQFDSTEPFLLLFFAIYLIVPILYAFKRAPERRDAIDGTLVFGNPLIAFGLQAALLDGERMPLAMSALALGVIYAIFARLLIHRARILGESFAVLALGFSTLAIPLALSARATGCIFALEGAALVWLGLRQNRRLPQWIGIGLQLLAAGAFVIAYSSSSASDLAFANGRFIGALLIAGAALSSAWLYLRGQANATKALPLYLWGLFWWFGAWLLEINHHVTTGSVAAVLSLVAFSAWLAAEADRYLRQMAVAWTTAILLWFGVPLGFAMSGEASALNIWNLLAYAAYAVFGWRSLICLRNGIEQALSAAHLGWLWTWTCTFAWILQRMAIDAGLGTGWQFTLAVLPLLVTHFLGLLRPGLIAAPLSSAFKSHRPLLLIMQAVVLALLFVSSLSHSGVSHPLVFIPVMNPLELMQLAILGGFLFWSRDHDAPEPIRRTRPIVLAIAGFLFVTAATLRGAHHLGGIPWNEGVISASISQTSLAVVWSLLGVAGWVIGSRRGNRPLWLAGALLMAVVLVKLLLIDRQHLGNLFGIASFIAYGLLCTLIGYLAPAPPRGSEQEQSA